MMLFLDNDFISELLYKAKMLLNMKSSWTSRIYLEDTIQSDNLKSKCYITRKLKLLILASCYFVFI